MDQEARRGEEGVSQCLRALRIADHSAFLPSCLPRPEEHGTLPSFSSKARKGGGGRGEKGEARKGGRAELQAIPFRGPLRL